jgi:hypothetical protein
MNTNDDDILLGAYLDGELPPGEADALTGRLANEPALMARLETLRAGDAATRRVFASLDERPMPPAVLELLGAREPARTGDVVPMPRRVKPHTSPLPLALAAGVALVAGFLISNVVRETPGLGVDLGNGGLVAMNSELYALLETGISGEPRDFGNGTTGTLALTFEDRAGDWCREVAVTAGTEGLYGVACRRAGDWRMEAMGYGPAGGGSAPYAEAAGTAPAAVLSAIDSLIGPADPLGPSEEKVLVSGSWENSPE